MTIFKTPVPSIFGAANNTIDIKYVGIKAQLIKAFNAHLAERSQGSTLDTWEYDFLAAKDLDNARKSEGLKSTIAYKKYSDLHWAFRSTIKEAVTDAMKRKEVGKAGFMIAIPHIAAIHKALGGIRAKFADQVYGADAAMPIWECSTLVGHNEAKEAIFEKSEIWTIEEFTAYCGTTKFLKDAVKWAVSAALQSEVAPALIHSDGEILNRFSESLEKGVESRIKQDVKDEKALWNRMGFFEGGLISTFKEDMHVETCLAMVGRVVKSYNNIVGSASYDLGRMLNERKVAGLESSQMVYDVLGHELTVEYDLSTGETYIAEDLNYKDFILELEVLTSRVEGYMAAWEKILPRKYLISLGTDFNGGYGFNDIKEEHIKMLKEECRVNNQSLVKAGKPPVKFVEPVQFSKLAYELIDITAYFDVDKFEAQKERRLGFALLAEKARLAELKAAAKPIVI